MYSQSVSSWIGDPILVAVSVFQQNLLPQSSGQVKYTDGGSELLWSVVTKLPDYTPSHVRWLSSLQGYIRIQRVVKLTASLPHYWLTWVHIGTNCTVC